MLLTAGCSFVWGDELEGFDNEPPTHWPLTFTHQLAEKLGVEYVNLGSCGAGNELIFRNVTDFLHSNEKSSEVSHIVVLWSAWQRTEWVEYQPKGREINRKITRFQNTTQFSALRTEHIYDRSVREFYDAFYDHAYNSKTDIMHTLSKMKSLEMLCESKGIKLIQGVFHRRNLSNLVALLNDHPFSDRELREEEKITSIPDYRDWLSSSLSSLKPSSKLGMGFAKDLYTVGLENNDIKEFGHPGETSNTQYADLLFDAFNS